MEIVRYINNQTVIGAVPTVTVASPVVHAMLADLNRQRTAAAGSTQAS